MLLKKRQRQERCERETRAGPAKPGQGEKREGSFALSSGRIGNNQLKSPGLQKSGRFGMGERSWLPSLPPQITQAPVRNGTRTGPCPVEPGPGTELLQGWAAAPVPPSKSQGGQLVGRRRAGPLPVPTARIPQVFSVREAAGVSQLCQLGAPEPPGAAGNSGPGPGRKGFHGKGSGCP